MNTRTNRAEVIQVTFQQAQEAFLLRCKAKSLSPLTQGWYKGILGPLGRFLVTHGVARVPGTLHLPCYGSTLTGSGAMAAILVRCFEPTGRSGASSGFCLVNG